MNKYLVNILIGAFAGVECPLASPKDEAKDCGYYL